MGRARIRRIRHRVKLGLIGILVISLLWSERAATAQMVSPSQNTAAGIPQPDRRFLRIGKSSGQFTDEEYETLAAEYDYVLLAKFHGFYDINLHHEAAWELKTRRPDIRVFPYMNTKIWYTYNEEGWQEPGYDPGFDDSWLLRDLGGNLIPQRRDHMDTQTGFIVDLSNPDYRDWALGVLDHWQRVAPYDGFTFDAAQDLADGYDGRTWSALIGQEKLDAYNAGIYDLLTRAEALAGPGELIFNGIAPKDWDETRSLEKLEYTDGATDESFCVSDNGHEVLAEDIDIMTAYSHKKLFLHASFRDPPSSSEVRRVGRYCLGAFLMGWQPGSTYLKFYAGDAGFYGEAQLQKDFPFLDIETGNPTAAYVLDDGVYSRTFEHGTVFVNTTDEVRRIAVPDSATGTKRIQPRSALYFVDAS